MNNMSEINNWLFTHAIFSVKQWATATLLLFSISVFSQTEYEAPKLVCVRNNASQMELNWTLPVSPNPCFTGYEIYTSVGSKNGPYTLDTTLTNPLQTTVLLSVVSGSQTVHFFMVNRGSCNNPSPPARTTSDTLNNEKPLTSSIYRHCLITLLLLIFELSVKHISVKLFTKKKFLNE